MLTSIITGLVVLAAFAVRVYAHIEFTRDPKLAELMTKGRRTCGA